MEDKIYSIELSSDEVQEISTLISELQKKYSCVDDKDFVELLPRWVEYLPLRLRVELKTFRQKGYPLSIVKGFVDLSGEIGPTPNHWREVYDTDAVYDYFCSLLSTLCGDVVGFSDLQEGKLVQEIFPIKEDSGKQLGTGSVDLLLHTEDASLPYRADYIGFMCNRNVYNIPTIVSVPDLNKLSDKTLAILKQDKFRIFNDRPSFTKQERDENYAVCPIITGNGENMFMRYDPLFLDQENLTDADKAAMAELEKFTEEGVFDLTLKAGEIAFIDNYQCAHGRRAYQPKYDGTDRWLKRTQISTRWRDYKHLQIENRINVLP